MICLLLRYPKGYIFPVKCNKARSVNFNVMRQIRLHFWNMCFSEWYYVSIRYFDSIWNVHIELTLKRFKREWIKAKSSIRPIIYITFISFMINIIWRLSQLISKVNITYSQCQDSHQILWYYDTVGSRNSSILAVICLYSFQTLIKMISCE